MLHHSPRTEDPLRARQPPKVPRLVNVLAIRVRCTICLDEDSLVLRCHGRLFGSFVTVFYFGFETVNLPCKRTGFCHGSLACDWSWALRR